jgi:hypothetical protein
LAAQNKFQINWDTGELFSPLFSLPSFLDTGEVLEGAVHEAKHNLTTIFPDEIISRETFFTSTPSCEEFGSDLLFEKNKTLKELI